MQKAQFSVEKAPVGFSFKKTKVGKYKEFILAFKNLKHEEVIKIAIAGLKQEEIKNVRNNYSYVISKAKIKYGSSIQGDTLYFFKAQHTNGD